MRNLTLLIGICCLACAASAETLLVLPISASAGKSEDMAAINQLYHGALESQFKGTLVAPPDSSAACGDRECAMKMAREFRADSVIYSTLSRLGSKWIFNSTLVASDGGGPFNQRLTALSIEDMEAVTKRMADALLSRKNIEQAATLDNITQKENTEEPERRRSIYSTGIALGYIFPTTRYSFTYRVAPVETYYNDTSCVYSYYVCRDSLTPQPAHHSSQIVRLSWMNTWELRNDLLLDADLVWGAPDASFGADLNLIHLFNRGDFSPFLGGGLGLHWVHEDYNASPNKNNTGPTLNVQGGMMLFRTYDVHAMVRGGYQVVLNSDRDNGVFTDIAISYRKKESEKKAQAESGGFLSSVAKGIGYTFLGLMVFGLIVNVASN